VFVKGTAHAHVVYKHRQLPPAGGSSNKRGTQETDKPGLFEKGLIIAPGFAGSKKGEGSSAGCRNRLKPVKWS
jgi:hypothetical protein